MGLKSTYGIADIEQENSKVWDFNTAAQKYTNQHFEQRAYSDYLTQP